MVTVDDDICERKLRIYHIEYFDEVGSEKRYLEKVLLTMRRARKYGQNDEVCPNRFKSSIV